ncbi:hypothetical protein [Flavobacterium sharifuzzamanii]|uniref:hypothetical protein n=1 Tax=Flavobacterium sharifuzzamanii TaxID=2211133 RepID=UPI000DAC93B4|nr:hypothetical protein [Flavobacterium sharifuzzamanii]KAF2078761.1 hypothetical protein DMA14_19920 [Flavobacterium sharifuzzamanii]
MITHNSNNKENSHSDSIQNQFKISSSNETNLENTPNLYGMSLEQYKEGLEIHSRCFNQIEKAQRVSN